MTLGEIIGLVIVGLIVGALGRLFNPGANPIGLLLTIGIGIASMLIAGFIFGGILQWIVGIVVAVVLVGLVSRMMGHGRPAERGV